MLVLLLHRPLLADNSCTTRNVNFPTEKNPRKYYWKLQFLYISKVMTNSKTEPGHFPGMEIQHYWWCWGQNNLRMCCSFYWLLLCWTLWIHFGPIGGTACCSSDKRMGITIFHICPTQNGQIFYDPSFDKFLSWVDDNWYCNTFFTISLLHFQPPQYVPPGGGYGNPAGNQIAPNNAGN